MPLITHTVTLETFLPGAGLPLDGTWTLSVAASPPVFKDTTDHIVFAGRRELDTMGGLVTLELEETGQPGLLPVGGQWQLSFRSKDHRTTLGPFTFSLTSDMTLDDILAVADIPPTVIDEALSATDVLMASRVNNAASSTTAALKAKYVQEGSAFADIGKQAGVDPTGVTECAAAIQTALNAILALGGRAYGKGTFKIGSTVTLNGNADLSDATFNYTGATGTAVVVGATTPLRRASLHLPKVVNTAKGGTGWAAVVGSVGVKLLNLYSCELTVPHIQSFETGLRVAGASSQGSSYSNIDLGHLDNNKVNIELKPDDATGWVNQNNFLGGRCSHNSGEGTVVSGTKHVSIPAATNIVNGNVFTATSLESPNVVEYHLDCAGLDNYFDHCRWENTGTGPRVVWRTNSKGNTIDGGYDSYSIVQTVESGAANEIRSRLLRNYTGGNLSVPTLTLENPFSSTGAYVQGMTPAWGPSGHSLTSDWLWRLTGTELHGKQRTDTDPRVRADFANARLYFGTGAVAPTAYLSGGVNGLIAGGGNLFFDTDNTRDIGSTSTLRPRYVRVATAVVTGAAVTGSRPAAATAGVGAMFFDTTLGKPIWSNGTVWKDATGTTV